MMPGNQPYKGVGANSWEKSTDERVPYVNEPLLCVKVVFLLLVREN